MTDVLETITDFLAEWAEEHGHVFQELPSQQIWGIYLEPRHNKSHVEYHQQAIKRWFNNKRRYYLRISYSYIEARLNIYYKTESRILTATYEFADPEFPENMLQDIQKVLQSI